MKYEVKNRFTGAVQFTAEIDCNESDSFSIKLGLAVRWAVTHKANLYGADLSGAYLCDANLRGAYLCDANLRGAYLCDAYLCDANLRGADLSGADLSGANLSGANLRGADLSGADLSGANLSGANLSGANLRGAKFADYTFDRAPIMLQDKYHIQLWDGYLVIGCEKHTVAEWKKFTYAEIRAMDGADALRWWKVWKPVLMGMAKATGRVKLPKVKK